MTRAPTDGIPEPIGYEATPLPDVPVPPSEVPGFSSLPIEAQAQLERIHVTLCEQDVAIARLHGVRNIDQEVERIRQVVSGLHSLASVPELLRIQSERLAGLAEWRGSSSKDTERLISIADKLDRRLDAGDLAFEQIKASIAALGTQIGQVSASLKNRIDGVGDELAALDKATSAALDALTLRVAELEKGRTMIKAWAVLIAFLLTIAGLLAKFYPGSSSK